MNRKAVEQYRLSLFGRMVMGVSHEVDNHLSVILGFAELIQLAGGDERKAVDAAGKILAAGERINAIVKQFSHYVRPHAPLREPFVPGEVLAQIVLFAKYDLGRGNVTLSPPERFPDGLLAGDRRDFALSLLALLVNGAEAMAARGGRLGLSVEDRGDAWEFRVTDEGPGIPPEVLPRVFEEGFTTRSEPFNAGMGLPVARHLVADAGGTVSVGNLATGGCEATIVYPVRPRGR
ncbi:MAG: sensor histidine kinase [Gemmatimonadota bacterium]